MADSDIPPSAAGQPAEPASQELTPPPNRLMIPATIAAIAAVAAYLFFAGGDAEPEPVDSPAAIDQPTVIDGDAVDDAAGDAVEVDAPE